MERIESNDGNAIKFDLELRGASMVIGGTGNGKSILLDSLAKSHNTKPYRICPHSIRQTIGSKAIVQPILNSDGTNILSVLLHTKSYYRKYFDRIMMTMRGIWPSLNGLDVVENNYTAEIYWLSGKGFRNMSDNQIKVLCWLVLFHSPVATQKVLLLDDFCNGLDSSVTHKIFAFAQKSQAQIIFATSNPYMIDGFYDWCNDEFTIILCTVPFQKAFFAENIDKLDKIFHNWNLPLSELLSRGILNTFTKFSFSNSQHNENEKDKNKEEGFSE